MNPTVKGIVTIIAICVLIGLIIFGLFSAFTNRQIIDTTQRFDHAMIKLADGEIVEGRVDSWRDYENSDQIQVTINGTTYLIHSTNVTLIKN